MAVLPEVAPNIRSVESIPSVLPFRRKLGPRLFVSLPHPNLQQLHRDKEHLELQSCLHQRCRKTLFTAMSG